MAHEPTVMTVMDDERRLIMLCREERERLKRIGVVVIVVTLTPDETVIGVVAPKGKCKR